ncbi:hypothetical protein CU100_15740 [Phyllobacterium endophyticum]|uniref:Uncharacterized protein n=2 Tax=Phyllobacterium endophyticum TaxID=1149773 RepID=A0A2P7ARJ6_9HYPH|nr:hypothetical protein CU100_15740 [Phyllobacterium endophyticum]
MTADGRYGIHDILRTGVDGTPQLRRQGKKQMLGWTWACQEKDSVLPMCRFDPLICPMKAARTWAAFGQAPTPLGPELLGQAPG